MNVQEVIDRIPFLDRLHLAVEMGPGGEARARMESRPELQNHVGTLHAGALFTAAETAAGVAAWSAVPGDRAFVLLRSASVDYRRRPEGAVTASASVDPEVAGRACAALEESGRADLTVAARALDAIGAVVLEGTFDYALRPRREP